MCVCVCVCGPLNFGLDSPRLRSLYQPVQDYHITDRTPSLRTTGLIREVETDLINTNLENEGLNITVLFTVRTNILTVYLRLFAQDVCNSRLLVKNNNNTHMQIIQTRRRVSDEILPVFLQLVVRRSVRMKIGRGASNRCQNTVKKPHTLKSHDQRGNVRCNDNPK